MKIQCENCGTQHELDPPSWVVSSGRAFRFRCSACGHSQSVQPEVHGRDGGAFAAPTEVPATRTVAPTNPTLSPPDDSRPPPAPVALPSVPSVPPPQLIESNLPAPERGHEAPQTRVFAAVIPSVPPPPLEPPQATPPGAEPDERAVYLKQNGQIYMVRDWATLERWIAEGRVDQNDLVSEGGVRWEPIGTRTDLAQLFGRSRASPPPATSPAAGPVRTPFPFGGDTPFSSAAADAPWTDDDTEGIPTGLPPLPTEETARAGIAEALPPALADDDPLELAGEATSDDDEIVGEDPDTVNTAPPESHLPAIEAPRVPTPTRPSPPRAEARKSEPEPRDEAWEDLLAPELAATDVPAPTNPGPPGPEVVVSVPAPAPRVAAPPIVEELPPEPGRSAMATASFAALTAATVLVILLGGVWWTQPGVDPGAHVAVEPVPLEPQPVAPVVVPPPDPPPEPVPVPVPVPVAAPEPPPAPAPAPVAVAAPAPAPVAAPAPAPAVPAPAPAPAPPSVSKLLEQAWNNADSNPKQAQTLFEQVLAQAPANEDATYGYGYVLLVQNRPGDAAPWLCRVRGAKDPEIRQDVGGMIEMHHLSCP